MEEHNQRESDFQGGKGKNHSVVQREKAAVHFDGLFAQIRF